MVGPGKPFNTDRYFVICSNILGGCKGTTGPNCVNPETGKEYGLSFPIITVDDMVRVQKELIDYLGIEKLLCVAGGSLGGMQALSWTVLFPERVASVMIIASAAYTSTQGIAFDKVGRNAIMSDPRWNNGDYYGREAPERGLALARMIGHITFMSDQSMEEKFSRRLTSGRFSFGFDADFEVEGYLHYRGANFVKRFDANSYLYITKAIDYFDLSGGRLIPGGKAIDTRFLIISFKSDWLYPSYQSQEIVRLLKRKHVDATYCELRTTYGHDAFLVEVEEQTTLIKHFLDKTFNGYLVVSDHGV
jgi:homoserine O-acetyltransferase